MRASRAASLAVLTVGLTVGGISAAAADDSSSRPGHATTNWAAGSGAASTTADGVTRYRANEGVTAGGHAFHNTAYLSVKAKGVSHDYTYQSSRLDQHEHGDRRHDDCRDDERRGDDRRGDDRRCDDRGRHDDRRHDGLVPDVLEDLL